MESIFIDYGVHVLMRSMDGTNTVYIPHITSRQDLQESGYMVYAFTEQHFRYMVNHTE